MYNAKAFTNKGFDVCATSKNNKKYILKMTEEDGPMDVFTVAFSSCILMCAKGYFFRTYNIVDLLIEIDLQVDYENKKCLANLYVDYKNLLEEDKKGILNNIKLRCKISHLLSDNVDILYNITNFKI